MVDSVGSGDAFSAAFMHALLHKAPLAEAVQSGNILGALVAATKGATEPVGREEIERFRSAATKRIYDPDFESLV